MRDRVYGYHLFVRDPVTNEPLGPMPVVSTCAADDYELCSDVNKATFSGDLILTAETEWILLLLFGTWYQNISEHGGVC